MNILLDTHIAVWAITDDPRLSEKARELILDPDNSIYWSAVSTLEVNNKRKSKHNNLDFTTADFIDSCIAAGFIELPLRSEHFLAENALSWAGIGEEHKDPFDRLLIAQAKNEKMRFLTKDQKIADYDEKCVLAI